MRGILYMRYPGMHGDQRHPSLGRMRIGVDRGNARGNKTLFFSASAPPIARHTSPPDLAAAPHTPTRRLGAHEQLAESVGTAPLQLGSRQPCRPPPHTRASMAAACVPGLSRPPSRGGSGPFGGGAQRHGRVTWRRRVSGSHHDVSARRPPPAPWVFYRFYVSTRRCGSRLCCRAGTAAEGEGAHLRSRRAAGAGRD